jgi:uncharacterized protein
VSVVADSSPLVVLAKLGCFDLLKRLFPRVYISSEVHHEVVIAGAGLPGSSEVSKAEWIEVKAVKNPAEVYSAQEKYGLGPGQMSTILLAKELRANPVLLDDYKARKVAKAEGLGILGSIGLLETFYLRRYFDRPSGCLSGIRRTTRDPATHQRRTGAISVSACENLPINAVKANTATSCTFEKILRPSRSTSAPI